jgi:hypothetical protein
MMQFVKVNDDVVSVELSVDTLYTIGNALDTHVDVRRDQDVSVDRELALANGFKNAYRAIKGDQSVPADSEVEDSGLE